MFGRSVSQFFLMLMGRAMEEFDLLPVSPAPLAVKQVEQ
jgi:hypothetical protein